MEFDESALGGCAGRQGFLLRSHERVLGSGFRRLQLHGLPLCLRNQLLRLRTRSLEQAIRLLFGFVTHDFGGAMGSEQNLSDSLLDRRKFRSFARAAPFQGLRGTIEQPVRLFAGIAAQRLQRQFGVPQISRGYSVRRLMLALVQSGLLQIEVELYAFSKVF